MGFFSSKKKKSKKKVMPKNEDVGVTFVIDLTILFTRRY